MLAEFTQYYYR